MSLDEAASLHGKAVHLWLARRGDAADEKLLSVEEQRRAACLRQAPDRSLFMLAHAALRDLISRYAGLPAASLQFDHGPYGKPCLPAALAADLCFNLSHSGDAVLIALARGHDLGVDIEALRPHRDLDAIAAEVFADDERRVIAAAGDHRLETFYELWTRKEACVKAWGRGLGIPLRAFSVVDSGASGIECPDDAQAPLLFCRRVAVLPGYAAAVAMAGEPADVLCRRWRNQA